MRVAVDTNVLVSAAIADGPPRRVLDVAAEGVVELVLPDLILVELERVLVVKLALGSEVFQRLEALLDELPAMTVPTPATADQLSGDPADDRILAAVLESDADVLVSGDRRHLLPLGEVAGMPIIRPQELLADLAR